MHRNINQAILGKYLDMYKNKIRGSIIFFYTTYKLISGNSTFDIQYYISQTKRPIVSDIVQDYCTIGLLEGLNPCKLFHSIFYLIYNTDVLEACLNPYAHYVQYGINEQRCSNQFDLIESFQCFDFVYYNYRNGTSFSTNREAIEFYCNYGWKINHKPTYFFDTKFYTTNFPNDLFDFICPLAEYLVLGKLLDKKPSKTYGSNYYYRYETLTEEELSDYNLIYQSNLFDPQYYLSQSDAVAEINIDPILHYVKEWNSCWLNPSVVFNTKQFFKEHYFIPNNPLANFIRISSRNKTFNFPDYDLPQKQPQKIFPFFSIILPTWNREETISLAIDSVLAQTYKNFELVIIDDGSTDNTASLINSKYAKYLSSRMVRYIYIPHSGVSAARNQGLVAANYDYIAYIDADNIWRNSHLTETSYALYTKNHFSSYGKIKVYDLSEDTSYTLGREFDYNILKKYNFIDINAFSHHKKIAFDVGLFDTNMTRLVDWDFILRCLKNNHPAFIDNILCEYFILPYFASITTTENYEENFRILSDKHR